MGLCVSVGLLASVQGDEEGLEWSRADLVEINRVLAENGLPPHDEPERLPELKDRSGLGGMPYSWLHYLRRAFAYARQAPAEFAPVAEGEGPSEDERIDRELTVFMDSHLVCHSDCEGFYVPIDFPEPLHDDTDELAGGILGSSQQALREVVRAAPLLGIRLRAGKPTKDTFDKIREEDEDSGPYWIERKVWACMYEAFRLSVEHKAIVVFG